MRTAEENDSKIAEHDCIFAVFADDPMETPNLVFSNSHAEQEMTISSNEVKSPICETILVQTVEDLRKLHSKVKEIKGEEGWLPRNDRGFDLKSPQRAGFLLWLFRKVRAIPLQTKIATLPTDAIEQILDAEYGPKPDSAPRPR